jgi:GT2 family glycosyltransferase
MNSDRSKVPLVAISILNWNGWQDTLQGLESLRRLDYPNYLTIIVDNGSWDDSVPEVRAWALRNLGESQAFADYSREIALNGGIARLERQPAYAGSPAKLVLIRNQENLGFTGGHNTAIHFVLRRNPPAQYIFLLNNDARVEPECLTHLVSVSRKSGAAIVGAIVKDEGGQVYFAGSGSFRRHLFCTLTSQPPRVRSEEFWESPIAHGAAMLVSRQVLEHVYQHRGMYLNEDLFAYGDELEFCSLAHRHGYKTAIARDAAVYHDSAKRRGRPCDPRYFFYYFTRNHLHLAKAVLPLSRRLIFHAAYLPLCARRMAKRLIAGEPHLARAIACGLLDGYRGVTGKWRDHDREATRHLQSKLYEANESNASSH